MPRVATVLRHLRERTADIETEDQQADAQEIRSRCRIGVSYRRIKRPLDPGLKRWPRSRGAVPAMVQQVAEFSLSAQSKTREVGDEMRVRIRTRVWGGS